MESHDVQFLVPRAVGIAIRLRKKIDHFHRQMYTEEGIHKIGYGYNLDHGISEPVALTLAKSRLLLMGQALMRRAFEMNLAADPARFSVFVDIAERVGDKAVLAEDEMWQAAKVKDYWRLNQAFLTSSLIVAYGDGKEGRRRVAYLGRVLVEGESAV